MPLRERFLPETCTIQSVDESVLDERGLPSNDWANATTGVRAKFESQGMTEDRDGRNTTVETFNVYLQKGVSVVPGDRLVRGNEYHEIIIVTPYLDRYGVECYKQVQTLVRT